MLLPWLAKHAVSRNGRPPSFDASSQHQYSELLLPWPQKLKAQREASRQRKEENRKKAMVTQKISNPATLKKMMKSKKDRKKLMAADTL
jgi:hypothetical protein